MPYLEVLRAFLKLGLTSFGGPVAHIGYFHNEFVHKRQWATQAQFSSWLAICQALPGPASSQLGFLIGWHRAGWAGALLAWAAFTLPSAAALVWLALYGLKLDASWLSPVVHGLKLVAVVVVAQAVLGMFKSLCPDRLTRLLAALGLALAFALPGWLGQIGAIVTGGLIAMVFSRATEGPEIAPPTINHAPSRALGAILLTVFLGLLLLAPVLASSMPWAQLFDPFYRAGALVFGGGHVMLPLLESATVTPGHVSADDFLTGYGLAQAVPGPLFTFAAWLGALDTTLPGWFGASLALVAVFLPGLLLITGILPFWGAWNQQRLARLALAGINAAVVGVLASAWIDPIATTSLMRASDWAIAGIGLGLLLWLGCPVWLVVIALPVLTLALDWLVL
jgi:chromate transporter